MSSKTSGPTPAGGSSEHSPVPALDALLRLREGNDRFVHDVRSLDAFATQARRGALVTTQSPFAVILSCSDSRVPSEIVFDQGLGSLFVVMGHTRCGAIRATIAALRGGSAHSSANVRDIVDRIRPAVAPLMDAGFDDETLAVRAMRANVVASANHLRHSSRLLEQRVASGSILVVSAEYSLETGKVDFFDGA